MTLRPISIPAGGWADPNQNRVMKTLETQINAISSALGGLTETTNGLVSASGSNSLQIVAVEQAHSEAFLIEFADDKDYTFVSWGYAWTIDRVVTKCTTGTCTVVVSIDGVNLGGPANSVSTGEDTQAHTSANNVVVGQDITITISSNAAAEGVAVTLVGRRSLALR